MAMISVVHLGLGAFIGLVTLATYVNADGVAVNDKALASTSPSGFSFVCSDGSCPQGGYQDYCPQCWLFSYDDSSSSLSCFCFDSSKKLQAATTISTGGCDAFVAGSDGKLECSTTGALQTVIKSNLSKKKKTAPPTIAAGDVVAVDFTFNCAAGNCPAGLYQKYCPRCWVSGTDLSCKCFTASGSMRTGNSILFKFAACTGGATTNDDGEFICPSKSGVITDIDI